MARYLISYTERNKNGTEKKKQGVRVNRFRKLLKQQGIIWQERVLAADLSMIQLPMWAHVVDSTSKSEGTRHEYGLYGPTGILCKNNDPNVMVEFTFNEHAPQRRKGTGYKVNGDLCFR